MATPKDPELAGVDPGTAEASPAASELLGDASVTTDSLERPEPSLAAKRLSGAKRRQIARASLDRRLKSELGKPDAYARLGEPPVDDPATGLEYVRRVQLTALAEVARSTLPQLEKWRLIKDMSATIGMTHNRAALEARLKKLEGKLREQRQAGAVRLEPGASVQRPPTARRGRRQPAVEDVR